MLKNPSYDINFHLFIWEILRVHTTRFSTYTWPFFNIIRELANPMFLILTLNFYLNAGKLLKCYEHLVNVNVQIFVPMWRTGRAFKRKKNVMEKLLPDPFRKDQNWAYLWINSLRFVTVCFYCMPTWEPFKHFESKLRITFFYLMFSFFEKLKEFLD